MAPLRPPLFDQRRPAIGAIYSPPQGQVKNGESADFGAILPGTSLVCEGMNRYLAGTSLSPGPRTSSPHEANRIHPDPGHKPLYVPVDRFRDSVLADRLQRREYAQ